MDTAFVKNILSFVLHKKLNSLFLVRHTTENKILLVNEVSISIGEIFRFLGEINCLDYSGLWVDVLFKPNPNLFSEVSFEMSEFFKKLYLSFSWKIFSVL